MKVEVKETQSNEVDWSKNPQLVEYRQGIEFYIVLTGKTRQGEIFEGTIIHSNIKDDSTFFVGRHKDGLIKDCFTPFHGTITIQND